MPRFKQRFRSDKRVDSDTAMNIPLPLYILGAIFAFLFGSCIGSFLNVCILRLPRGESLISPGSHCPDCGHGLSARDNIPILGWLFLRGRCRYCSAPISPRYPVIEAVTASLYAGLWLRTGAQMASNIDLGIAFFFLTAALIAVTVIDVEHYMIPDAVTYSGLFLAFLLAVVQPGRLLFGGKTAWTASTSLFAVWINRTGQVVPGGVPIQVRVEALMTTIMGMVVGGGLLWGFMVLGRALLGTGKGRSRRGRAMILTPDTIYIEGVLPTLPWEDVLCDENDQLHLSVRDVRAEPQGGHAETLPASSTPGGEVCVDAGSAGVSIGGVGIQSDRFRQIEGIVTAWRLPREPLGFGDVKLLAMIGALAGPEAALFVLTIGALAGTIVGGVWSLMRCELRYMGVPFAPFLALGGMLWMFAGGEIVRWYASFCMELGEMI